MKILSVLLMIMGSYAQQSVSAPFEIKVHDELIAEYQESAFEIETNLFQAPASAPGIRSNVFQTRLEYGYGVSKNSEIGVNLYFRHYNSDTYVNGGKISYMYVPTHDESGIFHYGIKNEINYIRDIGGNDTTFYELTPIIALQLQDWRITLNPSIDITLTKNSTVTFAPSAKVIYSVTPMLGLGMEYYADNLAVKDLYGISQQPNTAYVVMDAKYNHSTFNFGVGKGVNSSSDNWVIKLIASIDFE